MSQYAQDVKLFGKWSFDDIEVGHTAYQLRLATVAEHHMLPGRALDQRPSADQAWACCSQVNDISLEDYITVKQKSAIFVPHTAGRYQKKRFRKAQCPVVERWGLCELQPAQRTAAD